MNLKISKIIYELQKYCILYSINTGIWCIVVKLKQPRSQQPMVRSLFVFSSLFFLHVTLQAIIQPTNSHLATNSKVNGFKIAIAPALQNKVSEIWENDIFVLKDEELMVGDSKNLQKIQEENHGNKQEAKFLQLQIFRRPISKFRQNQIIRIGRSELYYPNSTNSTVVNSNSSASKQESPIPKKTNENLSSPNKSASQSSLSFKAPQIVEYKPTKPETKIAPEVFSKPTKSIVNRQFVVDGGVGLYHNIPSKFVRGQFYLFNGEVTNPSLLYPFGYSNYKFNYVNIIFSSRTTRQQFKCLSQIKNKVYQFSISCQIKKSGRYYITIFAGRFGRSSGQVIEVVDLDVIMRGKNVQSYSQSKIVPEGLRANMINNNLVVKWDSQSALTYLSFNQINNGTLLKTQFLLSNYHQFFNIPFHMFENFTESQTTIQIRHADSQDGTLAYFSSKYSSQPLKMTFEAIRHAFDQTKPNAEIIPEIPWQVDVGTKLRLNFKFQQNVKRKAYVIEPNKNIRIINLQALRPAYGQLPNPIFRAGTPLKLDLSFDIPGTHIIQVNDAQGSAIINRPVYVGNSLALLPDYQDMLHQSLQTEEDERKNLQKFVAKTTTGKYISEPSMQYSTLNQKRQYLLTLLNGLRQKYNQPPVIIDGLLNKITQAHTDDMKINNYFSHTSLNGDGPGERAQKFNFKNSIGENIAQSFALTEAHLGLQRSAGHLHNSVDPEWTRVGIGISITNGNQYIVGFTFAGRDLAQDPLKSQQIGQIQRELVGLVQQRNNGYVKENKKLTNDIKYWLMSESNSHIFDSQSQSSSSNIFEYLTRKAGYSGPMALSSFRVSYSKDWADTIKDSNLLQRQNFRNFGVGVRQNKVESELESYIIFI